MLPVKEKNPDGKYKGGCDITIEVLFSETVYVTVNPRIELATGSTLRFANYTSRSENVLWFVYTVVSGDVFSDLDYTSTSSLSNFNSSTIRDSAANNAILTLASPGASGSLGYTKAFVYNSKASSCGS